MNSFVFPGNIDQQIAAIGAQPIPYMRTAEFSAINLESERILLELIHCQGGKTIIYTGSGTGAMSAVIENYVSTKRKAFVLAGGSFGKRWSSLCRYYGIPYTEYTVPFSKVPDYDDLEQTVLREQPDVFLCQHHETSSGVLYDLKRIADICHKVGASPVVDVISSFLAEELDMDALGLDICITSTQKGLNIPPGLSVLFLSKRLEGYHFAHGGYYWDFEDNLANLRRGQTPFSPATTLYLQLNARLRQLASQGGEHPNIEAVHHRALVFRNECQRYGWQMPAENPSSAITAIMTADNEERRIFRALIEKNETFIMPGGTPGHYRISHMGISTDEEIISLAAQIHELEEELCKK